MRHFGSICANFSKDFEAIFLAGQNKPLTPPLVLADKQSTYAGGSY
jgi:hypothetical protein